MRRHKNVVNITEVDAIPGSHGTRFAHDDRRLGAHAGGTAIGCSYYEVPPGKTAFPHHFHCANEESVFIVEGEGTMRIGPDKVAVRAGDYIALPPGPEGAHQLVNTSNAPIKYLCMSTMISVDIVGYPDSKKHGASASPSVEAAMKGERWVRHIWGEGPSAGYYDGEE